MDAAAAARMSGPRMNPHFRRRWQEPAFVTEREPTVPADAAVEPRLERLAEVLRAELRRSKRRGPGGAP
jgi:hypothetical protein